MKKDRFNEAGSAIIQFALALPMLIYILAFMFDIGYAISSKVNLQHLASELQKVTVYTEQGAARGGINGSSQAQYFRDRVLEEQKNLDRDQLEIKIRESGPEVRRFENHHYWMVSQDYVATINTNTVKYVTIDLEYTHKYNMALVRALFGDQVILKESFTNLVFVKTDKAW